MKLFFILIAVFGHSIFLLTIIGGTVIYRDLELEAVVIDDSPEAPKFHELEVIPEESLENAEENQGEACDTNEGVIGTCMTLEKCYPFFKYVDNYDLGRTGLLEFVENATKPCGSENSNDDRICCGERSVAFARISNDTNVEKEGDDIFNVDCGVSTPPDKGISGRPSRKNEYIFAVSLLKNNLHYCSGSLLSSRWVITAAHCVNDIRNLADLTVNVGEYDLTSKVDHISRDVDKIVYHSEFKMRFLSNDIALLRLKEPVEYSDSIRPICLVTSENDGKVNFHLIGWGRSVAGGNPESTTLHTIRMRPLSLERCKEKLKFKGSENRLLMKGMLCSETVARNYDLIEHCEGDSGSALITKEKSDRLVGLSSWSLGCRTKPGIYVDIQYYLNWIRKNLKE